MKKQSNFFTFILCFALLAASGCGKSDDAGAEGAVADTSLPASLFLAEAPVDVAPISMLKDTVEEGDTVTIRAVVGGAKKAFVAGRAVMTVIDVAVVNPCTADDDHCPTPWDYCCTPPEERLLHMASVQIVDAENRPLAVDLSTIEQVKPLSTLIIQGTVGPRPDQASLVIHAQGIFVESQG
jgi:hypothetical protein